MVYIHRCFSYKIGTGSCWLKIINVSSYVITLFIDSVYYSHIQSLKSTCLYFNGQEMTLFNVCSNNNIIKIRCLLQINVREYRRANQKWTIKRNWQQLLFTNNGTSIFMSYNTLFIIWNCILKRYTLPIFRVSRQEERKIITF